MNAARAENLNYANVSTFPREKKLGSDAFSLEKQHELSDPELRDNIVSYLGEYRFAMQKWNYSLHYSPETGLTGVNDGESLIVKGERTITKRQKQNLPTHREEAELRALDSLRQQIAKAETNDTLLWASPQGPKSEGYGDYGFLFVGKVGEEDSDGNRAVSMTAIRVENNPTIPQWNRAINLLTGYTLARFSADQFLENPYVIKSDIHAEAIDEILTTAFPYQVNQELQQRFEKALGTLGPLIGDVMRVIRTGSDAEKLEAFHKLENCAIELREKEEKLSKENIIYIHKEAVITPRLHELSARYAKEPPKVGGSCGSTGEDAMAEILGLEPDDFGPRSFACPACGKTNIRPKNEMLAHCQHCGSDKVGCKEPVKVQYEEAEKKNVIDFSKKKQEKSFGSAQDKKEERKKDEKKAA